MKPDVFLSFDLENDDALRELLFDEANQPNFPLNFKAWSEKGAAEDVVREKIRSCDRVLVMCGEMTFQKGNVDREFVIAKEEGKPYHLIQGRKGRLCSPPPSADPSDHMHEWSWEVLEAFAVSG
ncbi:MAG: hypothetical protein IH969_03565 [Candidatus Krumholzibacteriota bacterium]|nr:hypothetical protein [Candidatus Krumholzibacteriota bacterium]